jgi:hypothetical protein
MNSLSRQIVLVIALVSANCSSVRSTSMPTNPNAKASTGENRYVRLSATHTPTGAQDLGLVEAHGRADEFVDIVEAFRKQAAKLGGNFARIDSIQTKYEMLTSSSTYSYACGQATCTGSRTHTAEIPTLTVLGRAFNSTGEN